MEPTKELEDKLRESAATGDEEAVRAILEKGSVNVNSQHLMNGWTALHWAAQRGHFNIAALLLKYGADKTLKNNKGETPLQLASDPSTRVILGGEPNAEVQSVKEQSFVPNYLANPPFPYVSSLQQKPVMQKSSREDLPSDHCGLFNVRHDQDSELVIKARVANAAETDFIEVELECGQLSFDLLVTTLCNELGVKRELIHKVRKLPNTILRKDKDVQRLKELQEVELVLSNRATSEMSRNYGPSVSPKHIDVVY